jgi:hypothetical protein
MRSLILSFALALTVLVSGCQTPHSFATPDSSWKSHVGQLKFSNRQRTVIGEVVVQQRGAHEFQLDFLKAGGLPLMSVREDLTSARTDGLLVRGSWQGTPRAAPRSLRPWIALREAFLQVKPAHGAAALADVIPAMPGGIQAWKGQSLYSGGELSTLSMAYPEDDQRFEFQFQH